jgi:hypothetical protein
VAYGNDVRQEIDMKYPAAIRAREFLKLAIVGGIGGLLPMACAPVNHGLPVRTEAQTAEQFNRGEVVLDCQVACAGNWKANRPELLRRYIAQNWSGLADLVVQTGYQEDLAYFYLGRAAEGLGQNEAALSYYRVAGALATGADPSRRCNGTADSCDGFTLPRDIYAHIQIVRAAEGKGRPVVARRSPSRPKPGQPAPIEVTGAPLATPPTPPAQPVPPAQPAPPPAQSETWIDPPPVTR